MLVLTLLVFVFVFSVGKLLCPALLFTVSLHCGLAGFFVFYCPFPIHPETEGVLFSWGLLFQGLQKKTCFMRDEEGLRWKQCWASVPSPWDSCWASITSSVSGVGRACFPLVLWPLGGQKLYSRFLLS